MSARQLRALAALHEPTANDFELGQVMGLREAADIMDVLAAKLEDMADAPMPYGDTARVQEHAFRIAARLVRGDEAGGPE